MIHEFFTGNKLADGRDEIVAVSPTNPLPTTGGGGGGGSSLAETLWTDSAGVLWVRQDFGSTITWRKASDNTTGTPTGTVTPAINQPARTASGSIQLLNEAVTVNSGDLGGLGFYIPAFTSGTIIFQGSINGTNFDSISVSPLGGGDRVSSISGPWAGGTVESIGGGISQARAIVTSALNAAITVSALATDDARIIRVWSTSPKNLQTLVFGQDPSGNPQVLSINPTGALVTSNTKDRFRDGFTTKNAANWTFPTESGTQYARSRIDGNVAGESYLVVSLSALVAGGDEWQMLSVPKFVVPYEIEFGMSLSGRQAGQEFNVEMVGLDGSGNVLADAAPASVAISGTIAIASNVATVTFASAHPFRPGDYVYLSNNADSRFNNAQVVVTTVTPTTITFAYTIANGSYTAGGTVTMISLSGQAQYQAGIRWWGATAGNADTVSRNNDPRSRLVNWNPGNTQDAAAIPSEGGVNYASLNYVQPFRAKGSWHMEHTSKRLLWRTRDIDNSTTDRSTSGPRRMPVPLHDVAASYAIRIRAKNLPCYSVPVGNITAAAKSGSTTATLTIANHGLTTNDFITVYGIRDQTNFANLTTATQVASVVDANTITIAFGASATATSQGGFVIRVQGGGATTIQTAAVQSYQKTTDGLRLLLVGSASWTATIGETYTLFGCVDGTPTILSGLHGRYRVAYVSTTTIELEPVEGQDLSGVSTSPVNAGGALLRNTDLRINYMRVYERSRNEIDTTKAGSSIEPDPVTVVGTTTVSGTVGVTGYPTAAAAADAYANPTITHLGADTMRYNGATWDRGRSSSNAADGLATASAGNDNCIAFSFAFNGTTWDRVRSSSNAADAVATVATGNVNMAAWSFAFNGTTWDRIRSGTNASDAEATVATGNVQAKALKYLFNGTTWDREHGAWNTTTGDTGAKTTTFNGATQTNFDSRGAIITFNIGTVTGTTPSMTPKVQWSPDGGTTWVDVPGAATAAITATGVYTLVIYPGVTAVANASVSYPLGRTWRIVYTISGTTPSFTITNVQVAYLR